MTYRRLLLLFFFCLWVSLGFILSLAESPTFDEPVHLRAGELYAQGNYGFDPIEPPLVRRLVFAVGSRLTWLGHPEMLLPYRLVVVFVTGVLASALVYFQSRSSLVTGLITATLLLGEANLLAHSHYFTTDAISGFLSLFVYLYLSRVRHPQPLLLGLLLGLTVSTKIATLAFLLPLLFFYRSRLPFHTLFISLVIGLLVTWGTYNFGFDRPLPRLDLRLPLGGFLRSLKENIQFSLRGQPLYFWDAVYRFSPWWKSPLLLATKISLPLLILSLFSFLTGKIHRQEVVLLGATLVLHTLKSLNFGLRHLLIVPLLLIVFTTRLKPRRLWSGALLGLFLVWHLFGPLHSWPQPLTFANELLAKPYQRFADSDYDWGQGLLELKKATASLDWGEIQLAYFGNTDPAAFLGPFRRVKDENPVASLPLTKLDYQKPLIVSVTCYHLCGYRTDPVFSRKAYTVLAGSFLYFP